MVWYKLQILKFRKNKIEGWRIPKGVGRAEFKTSFKKHTFGGGEAIQENNIN